MTQIHRDYDQTALAYGQAVLHWALVRTTEARLAAEKAHRALTDRALSIASRDGDQ